MTTATAALTAKIATLTTDALVELSLRLTLADTNEGIVLCIHVERELERRLTTAEFAQHIAATDALMALAA